MRVLLTNDDGITATGLNVMRKALLELPDVDLEVIAPDSNRSATGRAVTLRDPIWVEEVEFGDGTTGFATDGTPVDCVRFARDVFRAEWVQESEDVLAFWIEADTFMRHMVRVIIGTMLEGVSPERFAELLMGRPRSDAGATAAPDGLYLESVAYP